MRIYLGEIIVIGATIGLAKLYGDYRYWSGRCDSDKVHKTVIDAQHKIIEELMNERES